MHNLVSLTLIALLAAVPVARGQNLTPGAACPPGGGSFCACTSLILTRHLTVYAASFSNIILTCSTNGTNGVLVAGNCNDNVRDPVPQQLLTCASSLVLLPWE